MNTAEKINRVKVKPHCGGVFWPVSHRGGLVSFVVQIFYFLNFILFGGRVEDISITNDV
jgi:hypothetical protein